MDKDPAAVALGKRRWDTTDPTERDKQLASARKARSRKAKTTAGKRRNRANARKAAHARWAKHNADKDLRQMLKWVSTYKSDFLEKFLLPIPQRLTTGLAFWRCNILAFSALS